jgi:tetratricopeptide (TPR) repeat protein
MNKYYKFLSLIIITVFIIFSCLSSPDTDSKVKQANKYRETIKKYKLQKYANEDYNIAENNYNEAQKLLEGKNKTKADKALIEANNKYKSVIEKGFPLCTEEKNSEVMKIKNDSENIKAQVAVKEDYDKALSTYNEALKHKDSKNYEGAIDMLDLAKVKFDQVYKDANFKKERTEKSIDSTEKVKDEIDKKAAELDKKLN